MELELGVDILHYLKQFEEEGRDRGSSKVSKIATMFQFSDEGDERDSSCGLHAKVVRTESHVARFNTARALFEKMSERGGGGEKGVHKASKQRRASGGAAKGRGTPSPSGGAELSRSPSPGSNHPLIQPNGHAIPHPYKSSSTTSSIATISSSTSTPSSTFPTSISNSSIPAVLPLSSKKFSDTPDVSRTRWAPTVKSEVQKSKPGLVESQKNKSETMYRSEIKLTPDFVTPDFGSKSFMKNGISNNFEATSKDILNSKPDLILQQNSSKSKVDAAVKPDKPAKPETLIDKPISSHLQNKQIIQRHKNWFHSYSKNKSPSSTPSKSLSPASSNNPTPEPRSPRDLDKNSSYENLFSKGRKWQQQQSDDELSPAKNSNKPFAGEVQTHRKPLDENSASTHNDWRKERAAILSGRSCRSGSSTDDDAIPSPSEPPKGKTFEEVPTLPSCWSPPKQYNIYTSKPRTHDESGGGDPYPSDARGSKRSLAAEVTEVHRRSQGKITAGPSVVQTKEAVPSGVQTREAVPSGVQTREAVPSGVQTREAVPSGVQTREAVPSGVQSREAVPSGVQTREAVPSVVQTRETVTSVLLTKEAKEDRRRSMGEVSLRRKDYDSTDRESRLREWERRRSLREYDEAKVHGEGQDKRRKEEERRRVDQNDKKNKEEFERERAEEELEMRKREELERMRLVEEKLEIERREEELERIRLEEELERKRYEEEEIERRKREELARRKREEEEDKERKRREREELERRRREEEMEMIRIEKELKRKKEEEKIERKKREEAERKRIEEIERRKEEEAIEKRKREMEEIERKRIEELERKRLQEEEEESERKRKEELERKRKEELRRKREEEELEKKRIELERRRKEKEELERKRREEEEIRKIMELERRKKEKEELERKKKEEEEEKKIRIAEELEKKRIFDELERRKEEEIQNRKRAEEQEKRRKEEELRKEELERKWQAKREILEAEERERRERDRLEIEKTKRRIAELKRERDEMQRHQASRLRKLMGDEEKGGEEIQEERRERREIMEERRDERRISKEERREIKEEWRDERRVNMEESETHVKRREIREEERRGDKEDRIIEEDRITKEELQYERREIIEERVEERRGFKVKNKEPIEESNERKKEKQEIKEEQKAEERKEERRERPVEVRVVGAVEVEREREEPDRENEEKEEIINMGEEEKIVEVEDKKGRVQQVLYDHTVISAQHTLEFCSSPYNGSHPQEAIESSSPPEPRFSSSTTSSFEPLPPPNFEEGPPPVPPHNVDPATLAPKVPDSRLPPPPREESGLNDPEVMTPDEEKKLLSHNIIGYKKRSDSRRLLSDAEAKEVSEILSETPEPDRKENGVCGNAEVPSTVQEDDPDGFDKDYDSVCVDSPTPENQDNDYVFPGTQISEDGFVVRVKEVLNEEGIHYFEDGHFWIQVPGILEDDDDDLPDSVDVHKHTKIKFSKDPIKLYSTYSVTDYDRKNEDVDPVAASAEYELEKRVEKMDVFPVQIEKGDGGLGLSIIGMGVGADAGVEKLGIFVKTITPGGATDRDGRIRVNDQIIEVDNESLVGVTQVFAASVLKNTSGTVNFLIGRETDPESSEVAMLIRQSLLADHERDERRRALEGPNLSPRGTSTGSFFESFSSQSGADSASEDGHPTPFPKFKAPEMGEFGGLYPDEKDEFGVQYPGGIDQFGGRYPGGNEQYGGRYPGVGEEFGGRYPDAIEELGDPYPDAKDEFGETYTLENEEFGGPYPGSDSNSPLGVTSPPPEAFNHEVNAKDLMQSSEMIIMSQHLQEVQHRNEMYEEEINLLRTKLSELEKELGGKSELAAELQETTKKLKAIEDKLQSRQAEITTYQDMLEQSQGQYIILEKKYYKAKKIIKEYQSRERDFLHREEYHITQLEEKDVLYNSLVKALKDRVIQLEGDLMNAQHQAGIPVKVPPDLNSQTSTFVQTPSQDNQSPVQKEPPRKPSSISTLDADLSDNEGAETHTSEGSKSSTVERKVPSKEELDVAVPPTELLDNSFSKAKGELASRGGLANRQLPSLKKTPSGSSAASFEKALDDQINEGTPDAYPPQSPPSTTPTSPGPAVSTTKVVHSASHHEEVFHHTSISTSTSTTYASRPPPPYQSTHQHPPPYQPPPSAPLSHRPIVSPDTLHGARGDSQYRHHPPIARVQPVNRVDPPAVTPTHQQQQQLQQQQSLANQLKALLAEREGNSEPIQRGNREDVKKSPTSLMEDVRQAVMQADLSIGKKPVISGPIHVSSTAQVVSTGQFVHNRTSPQKNPGLGASLQQRISRDSGTWSPSLAPGAPPTSPSGGVVLLSQRPIEAANPGTLEEENAQGNRASALCSGDSTSSFDSLPQEKGSGKAPAVVPSIREVISVFDWTKEQVAQWLVIQGLENYVSTFVSAGITGPRLVNIDTKDLKNLGLSTEDKNKIKRKVKDLRQNLEKERKQIEKENKEREKLQKKAEKLAEKAEKRRK